MLDQKDLEEIGQFVIEELGKELINQRHEATGKLIASLDYYLVQQPQSDSVVATMLDYGKFVNTGRRRGAALVPIQALVDWVKQKGIETNNKKALGIAFAIQKTIQKEGSPTNNSKRQGKKTEFVAEVIDKITPKINLMVEQALNRKVQISIDNLVRRI